MDPRRFDRISKLFSDRRLSRRQTLAASGVGLTTLAMGTSSAAQDATPESEGEPADVYTGEKTAYLFVQSFHGGTIAPVEGSEDRFTVTLEQGTGQTIYFGDRPSRDVGVTDTPTFLEGLGFTEDNPPNAALIVETESGETDVAVVELYNPTYDPTNRGVTYEIEVLQSWQEDLELGLRDEPADLATIAPEFGSAHLLIDDCPSDLTVTCLTIPFQETVGTFDGIDSCWNYSACIPCEPYGHDQPSYCATPDYWAQKCADTYNCGDQGCSVDFSWPYESEACF